MSRLSAYASGPKCRLRMAVAVAGSVMSPARIVPIHGTADVSVFLIILGLNNGSTAMNATSDNSDSLSEW